MITPPIPRLFTTLETITDRTSGLFFHSCGSESTANNTGWLPRFSLCLDVNKSTFSPLRSIISISLSGSLCFLPYISPLLSSAFPTTRLSGPSRLARQFPSSEPSRIAFAYSTLPHLNASTQVHSLSVGTETQYTFESILLADQSQYIEKHHLTVAENILQNMPPKNSPGWATSPVKGEHDISRIEDFVFPAANNVPSDRPLDDTQPDGPSINILGSPTRQSVSASSEVRAWRNLEPYPPRPLGNVVRSHHLRRSTHNADLRRQIMSSRDASSTAASAGSNAEEIQSGNENASLRALESLPLHSSGSSAEWFKPVNRDPPHRPLASLPLSGSSAEWFKPVNRNASRQYSLGWLPPSESADSVAALAEAVSRERVENWRYTATTLDQSLLRSPLSPRPFTQSDFQLGGWNESTNSVETAYKVDDTPRAHNSRPSGRVSRNLETDNPGYAALSMMEQAQEQARLGMDLPRLGLDAGKMMDTERVRRGPKLVPSPKGKSRARGDPVKVS